VTSAPRYPDVSTRQKAWDVAQSFVGGAGVKLLP
jgi:hypothetical protein